MRVIRSLARHKNVILWKLGMEGLRTGKEGGRARREGHLVICSDTFALH